MRTLILLVIISVGVLSCSSIETTQSENYFSINDVVETQVEIFIKNKTGLIKHAIINNDSTQVQLTPDSSMWDSEMAIIRDMDINKPAYIGQYRVQELEDQNSNLSILSYTARDEGLVVKSMEVYFLDRQDNIKQIKIKSQKENSIFESSKEATLYFDIVEGQLVLIEYSIRGTQKMAMQDEVNYYVHGKLVH